MNYFKVIAYHLLDFKSTEVLIVTSNNTKEKEVSCIYSKGDTSGKSVKLYGVMAITEILVS